MALALAGLFAYGAEPSVAVAHRNLDQGYNGENCNAGDIECHEGEKLNPLTRNFEPLHIDS